VCHACRRSTGRASGHSSRPSSASGAVAPLTLVTDGAVQQARDALARRLRPSGHSTPCEFVTVYDPKRERGAHGTTGRATAHALGFSNTDEAHIAIHVRSSAAVVRARPSQALAFH
jgi:hypothetical protein